MRVRGRCIQIGLIFLFIFAFLISPPITGKPGLNMALASEEQTAAPGGDQVEQKVNDPYEHFNRKVFDFNDRLYFGVMKPVAQGYSDIFPLQIRQAIRNAFQNMVFPSRFVNFVLQGDSDKAVNELARFLVNSTVGLAGFVDIAAADVFRLEKQDSDFGQTLGRWGIESGPFLIIPILGPSSSRDLFGFVVDSAMDPLVWIPAAWWVSFTAEADKFINVASLKIGQYEELKKASLDPYVAMRDAYIQYRSHHIKEIGWP